MLEVRSIYSKLIVCVELGFHSILAFPDVRSRTFEYEHSVVNCRAGVVAEHILRGRWMVGVDIGGVDEVPFLVLLEVVDLWRPAVVGVRGVFGRLEDEFDFSRVPVTVKLLVVKHYGAEDHGR